VAFSHPSRIGEFLPFSAISATFLYLKIFCDAYLKNESLYGTAHCIGLSLSMALMEIKALHPADGVELLRSMATTCCMLAGQRFKLPFLVLVSYCPGHAGENRTNANYRCTRRC
jgi:hypothetical protein